jgi:hypothetical protein
MKMQKKTLELDLEYFFYVEKKLNKKNLPTFWLYIDRGIKKNKVVKINEEYFNWLISEKNVSLGTDCIYEGCSNISFNHKYCWLHRRFK